MAVNDYDPIIQAAARSWNVDPVLIKAIMHQETGGNPLDKYGRPITGTSGEKGLMQIMPATARRLGVDDPHDPLQAIFGAAKLLNENLDNSHGNPSVATMAYNGTPNTPATRSYLNSVSGHYKMFAGPGAAPPGRPAPAGEAKAQAGDDILKAFGVDAPSGDAVPKSGKAFSGDDILKAFETAALPATSAPAPPTTPNDETGAGRDEYGQPIAKLAAPEPSPPLPSGGEMGSALSAKIRSLIPAAPVQAEPPAGMGGAGEPATAAAGMGGATMAGMSPAATSVGNAVAHGFGSEPLGFGNKLVEAMRQAGIYPPANGNGTPAQRVNEALLAPAGVALDAGARGASAMFRGGQEGIAQLGKAIGDHPSVPFGLGNMPLLARDVAAGPEAFGGSPGMLSVPRAVEPPAPVGLPRTANPLDPTFNSIRGEPAPNSVGAAASAAEDAALTRRQTRAYNVEAFEKRLLEPQPPGEDPNIYIQGINPTEAHMEQTVNSAREAKRLSTIDPSLKEQADFHKGLRHEYVQDITPPRPVTEQALTDAQDQWRKDEATAFRPGQTVSSDAVENTIRKMKDDISTKIGKEDTKLNSVVKPLLGRLHDEDGNIITDPERLYGIRRDMNKMLSKPSMLNDPDMVHVKSQLEGYIKSIDDNISSAAPAYRDMMDNYSTAMKAIDDQTALQEIRPKLYNTKNEITLSAVQRQLAMVNKMRAAPGNNIYKSLTPESLDKLFNLRDDLRRVASSEEKARILGGGSDSSQNIFDLAKGAAKNLANLAAHGVAAYHAPVLGNAGIEMTKGFFRNKAVQKEAAANAARAQQFINVDPNKLRPINPPE